MMPDAEPAKRLIGLELASVTFVRDYVQLGFDGPTLNVMTPMQVKTGGVTVTSGDDQFRNHLCDLIGRRATAVEIRAEAAFHIGFDNGACVAISLRPTDYLGPEAVAFHGADGVRIVI